MIEYDELRKILSNAAEAISDMDNNPSTWISWITYFLQELENQAMDVNPEHQRLYEDMLSYLMDIIRNRLKAGGW